MGIDLDRVPALPGRRAVIAWMVGAYLTTFLVTRFVTRAIRSGRGPFHDASVGGVHLHHEVKAGELPFAAIVLANLAFALAAILQRRAVICVVGVFVPVVAASASAIGWGRGPGTDGTCSP